ncbi:PcfJ domain-containing protein [Pararhizobium sp. BT-229]|uniref:PcfJ domain-containing protein n=1 Tax=Pararhizobium sp. BT-229 TaxID=2986923 RepID=UPI0021F790AE|nr:PcfJ domain-containing protein [Pararhizobium sp. BT-229]MCV9963657.1 PcfJ domain-containing protein [Pararhizobium sp. BT-229]
MTGKNKEFTEKLVARIRAEQMSRWKGMPTSTLTRVHTLFDCSVRRVYLKTSADDETFRHVLARDADKVRHIMDWLVSAIMEDAHWLAKTDREGRPKKIMKCGTIDALAREADAWTKLQRNRKKVVALDPAEEEMFMDLGDGWRMVRMKTATALDRESGFMQHCVGDGAYDGMLRDPTMRLVSLRDHKNEPHVTVEMDLEKNRLIQVWGKANTIPKAEYAELMRPFFKRHGYWMKRMNGVDLFLFDPEGGMHVLDELKEGVVLRAIENVNEELLELLPARLTVEEGISLASVDLRPRLRRGISGIAVNGPADLKWANVDILPARHGFRGDIDLSGSNLRGMEDGFRCHGMLKLSANDNLRKLPYRMVVRGDLLIRDTPIAALPEDLSVGGDLTIRGTQIRKVPASVRVGGRVTFSRL